MPDSPAPLAFEDLIVLNDEIAAVIRAGVPLDLGLQQATGDVRGNLAKITERLAAKIVQGESLSAALASDPAFPRAYRAVVDAGFRSGRLPAALERVGDFGRAILGMRQNLRLAVVYPAILFTTAYSLLIVYALWMAPRLTVLPFTLMRREPGLWIRMADWLHQTVPYWGPAIPLAVLVCGVGVWGWQRYSRSNSGGLLSGAGLTVWRMLPACRSLLRDYDLAAFADLWSLLLEHQTPMEEALVLAGDATGSKSLSDDARQMADRLRAGATLSEVLAGSRALPEFFRWLVETSSGQAGLPTALKQTGDYYRRRGTSRAEWMQALVPILLVVVVGGIAALLYTLAVILPWFEILEQLTQEGKM